MLMEHFIPKHRIEAFLQDIEKKRISCHRQLTMDEVKGILDLDSKAFATASESRMAAHDTSLEPLQTFASMFAPRVKMKRSDDIEKLTSIFKHTRIEK